jgi:hypothetical protein
MQHISLLIRHNFIVVKSGCYTRALISRALAMIIVLSHRKQWGRASLEIRGEKGRCYSDSLKIEMVGHGV